MFRLVHLYQRERNLKEGVYLISDVAAKWYAEQLHETDQGKAIGLSYFKERGFTDGTIKKYGSLNDEGVFLKLHQMA